MLTAMLRYGICFFLILTMSGVSVTLFAAPKGRITRGDEELGDISIFTRYTISQKDLPGQTTQIASFVGIEKPTAENDAKGLQGKLRQPLQLGSGFLFIEGCTLQPRKTFSIGMILGKKGETQGTFHEPIGIAVDREGFVYVSDAGNHRIQKFSNQGKFIKTWGIQGSGPGELNRPMHIDFGPDEHLYVAEYLNDRIQVFDKNGNFIRFIGLKTDGKSYFDAPAGVTVDNNGYVYVADFYHHQIQKFGTDGSFIASFGKPGRVWLGNLHYPTDVALTPDENILIADAYNNRIQKMTPKGTFIAKWGGVFGFGIPASWAGYFKVATGIDVDPEGNIYVADFYNHRIQVLSPRGRTIALFSGQDEQALKHPTDVAIDSDGSIWVVDFGNDRIVQLRKHF